MELPEPPVRCRVPPAEPRAERLRPRVSRQAASVPVHFDEHHLSEVQNTASEEKLDQVVDSMKESKVAIIGEGWRRRGLCSLGPWKQPRLQCCEELVEGGNGCGEGSGVSSVAVIESPNRLG